MNIDVFSADFKPYAGYFMKNRWMVLFSVILIQVILGGVYAWSVFTPHLKAFSNLTEGQCGSIFGFTIAVFALSMIFGSRLLQKKGPILTCAVGALLFGCGYFLASLTKGNFLMLVLTISFLTGAGIGFCYLSTLSLGMRWFPDKKSLITGIAVAGFGSGAVVLSSTAKYFLNTGTDIMMFFRWMGIILGLALFVLSLFLSVPDDKMHVKIEENRGFSEISERPFLLCFAGFFCGTFAGLMIVGNLAPIVIKSGFLQSSAIQAVSIFAVGNAVGRIVWGYLFDKIGYKVIPASLACFAVLIFSFAFVSQPWVMFVYAFMLGFGFGANFVVYAAAISKYFGVDAFPRLYPICFLGYGFAGITGPGFGGYLADLAGSYTPALYFSSLLLFVSVMVITLNLRSFSTDSPKRVQGLPVAI